MEGLEAISHWSQLTKKHCHQILIEWWTLEVVLFTLATNQITLCRVIIRIGFLFFYD